MPDNKCCVTILVISGFWWSATTSLSLSESIRLSGQNQLRSITNWNWSFYIFHRSSLINWGIIVRWGRYWPTPCERERREDIFSQVFTMIHIKSFVQNIQTKTEMEPHDQFWPSSCDTLILLDQFLLSWHSFLSCSISYVVSREGKCHLQPKIVHIIFKKARKRIQFSFVVRIGANEVRQTDKRGKAQKTQLYCFM